MWEAIRLELQAHRVMGVNWYGPLVDGERGKRKRARGVVIGQSVDAGNCRHYVTSVQTLVDSPE